MRSPAVLSNCSLFAKLCPLFGIVSLLVCALLYLCVAIQPLVLVILLVLAAGFAALFWWKSERSKACRIIARIGLLAPPVASILLILAYCITMLAYGDEISVPQLCLLITLLLETTVLFAVPAFAVLALKGRRPDVILARVMAVVSLALSCFTVFYVATIPSSIGGKLLVTLIDHPVIDALLLLGTAGAAITSFDTLFHRRSRSEAESK